MASRRSRKKKPASLSKGRSNALSKSTTRATNLSASKSRQLIRRHHGLNKAHAQALAAGDGELAAKIAAEVEEQGGLERYQQASQVGQLKQRGGDSSVVLEEWFQSTNERNDHSIAPRLKLLEVGALSTENACSKSGSFDVTRIDLNAQAKGILKQDFMQRPMPQSDAERFDCISLSLVLNFVPDPRGRGEMLARVTQFLKHRKPANAMEGQMPSPTGCSSLFLVIPAPCVTNSRYLDEDRLTALMDSLGFELQHRKLTQKLVYYLWWFTGSTTKRIAFPKVEIRTGKTRNNFAIILE